MSKVVVIGDPLVKSDTLEDAAYQLEIEKPIEVKKYEWKSNNTIEEFQKFIKDIETYGPENYKMPKELKNDIEDADYILCHLAPISSELINSAKRLKLIGTCRGGLEHINVHACQEKNITVINIYRNTESVAEFTIGLMLAETRNIARSHYFLKEGKWVKNFPNDKFKTTLKNLKVGLFGLGNIGKAVLKKLNALEVKVIAYDPYIDINEIKNQGLFTDMVDIETLFSESDIISLHARITETTRNIVNRNLLSLMKTSSYLINTSRAELINKCDLIDALKEHKIAGAALDVYWDEPINPADELLKLENVTLTPHIAGDTVDAIPKSPYLLKDQINKYLKDHKQKNR